MQQQIGQCVLKQKITITRQVLVLVQMYRQRFYLQRPMLNSDELGFYGDACHIIMTVGR